MPPASLLLSTVILAWAGVARGAPLEVASLAELAAAAARDGVEVRMRPGTYRMTDLVPLTAVPARRAAGRHRYLEFSGRDSRYDLRGVVIEFDTALRAAHRPPIHTDEFVVSGSGNDIRGLGIVNLGDGVSHGGAVVGVTGSGNTLRDWSLLVRGSSPYGYGDLLGKGGMKHSGIHVTGSGTRLVGCKVEMRAFGHAIYLQEDCADVLLEDCEVRGVMRMSDEILRETKGPAFDRSFRLGVPSRSPDGRILPGYAKSLAEDGFRTYGIHPNLRLVRCRAVNLRGGFELRTPAGAVLEDCVALGCERGFWLHSKARAVRCKGDASNGPLLFLEGEGAEVELTLLPSPARTVRHALVTLQGDDHRVALRAESPETGLPPVLLGYSQPAAGEGMSPFSERPLRRIRLTNDTAAPLVVGRRAEGGEVRSRGPVQSDEGRGVALLAL